MSFINLLQLQVEFEEIVAEDWYNEVYLMQIVEVVGIDDSKVIFCPYVVLDISPLAHRI